MTNNNGIQPCTVCGAMSDSDFLFDKTDDGRGNDSISLYRCRSCKTVYLGKYNANYDDGLYAYYQTYLGKSKEETYDALTCKSYMQVLRLFASYGSGKSILDVGCGKGDFVDVAMQEGYSVEGIELSQHAVNIAQGFGLPVTKRDFFSNEIQDASMDIVTMFEVLEHLPDPVKFLCRAEAVVNPGGLIYLTTPNFNSLDRRVLGAGWDAIHREHLTYFTTATLLTAIRNNTSLEVLHVETRNVSSQLINYFRRLLEWSSSNSNQKSQLKKADSSRAFDLRSRIEKSPWLLLLKRGANSLLNASSLGSTIVILLRKRG